MADLTTSYLGLTLTSPIVVSSNPLTLEVDSIRQLADAGAGAVVLPSLFEEQLRAEDMGGTKRQLLPEPLRNIPDIDRHNLGFSRYLARIYQIKKAVSLPVIASINGSAEGSWVRYAKFLEPAGADAMELNLYYLPTKPYVSSGEIEQAYLTLVSHIRELVNIPIAVKLFPYISSLPHFATQLVDAGANGLVLFNRFYQPDFDIDNLVAEPKLELSTPTELRMRLRWAAILYKRVQADLALTGGVHSGADVVKALLAGGDVAMTASALLRHGPAHLTQMLDDLRAWMAAHGYDRPSDFRGLLSLVITKDRANLERANYIQVLQSYDPTQYE